MPGPTPQKDARRTNGRPDWVVLPRAGRPGQPPVWPISVVDEPSEHWHALWACPQAVAWEELGWTRVVARYAIVLTECEGPGSSAALLAEARQMEDRLGLSPMAMKRLQWELSPKVADRSHLASVTTLDDVASL